MAQSEVEIWKEIPNNTGYEISSFGNVRSIDRVIVTDNNQIRKYKGKILKQPINESGYKFLKLGLEKTPFKVHILVAVAFLDKDYRLKNLVVDHRDGNPLNNNLSNLRLITQHENSIYKKRRISKSGFVGVSITKYGRYRVSMYINGNNENLGYYKSFEEAKKVYIDSLKKYKNIDYEF